MMAVVIPVFTALPIYRQEVTLDNTSYILDIIWNERSAQWALNILESDETPVVEGIKLVLKYQLLDVYKNLPNVPPGNLFCVDNTGEEIKVTRTNLGDTVQLVYIPESELDTI